MGIEKTWKETVAAQRRRARRSCFRVRLGDVEEQRMSSLWIGGGTENRVLRQPLLANSAAGVGCPVRHCSLQHISILTPIFSHRKLKKKIEAKRELFVGLARLQWPR